MRVERHSAGVTASGDLYQRPTIILPPLPVPIPGPVPPVPLPGPTPAVPLLGPPPNPALGIPIFTRSRYRYYLRITQIAEGFVFGTSFTLGFELRRFNAGVWTNDGAFTALMTWVPAPAGYPSPGDYLTGDVKNAANVVVGRLTMGWLSSYLRKATIEIDSVPVSEAPLDNGAGVNWKSIFDGVGWDVTVVPSNTNVLEPSGNSWSDAEMHAAMLARRDASNLDAEWRYHVLAVRNIDSTPRGIMYDVGATDSDNVPREGIGIASHWVIPNADPWGLVKNMRFGTAAKPYFRTAVHEIGHAMGLYHNTVDNGFMNTTDVIAASATPSNPFPNNIQWSHAPDDQKRLRHYPDVFVRSGGTAFGTASNTTPPITPTDVAEMPGLVLRVSPLLPSVPVGAPVRVNLDLVNESGAPLAVPESLGLKSGFVSGRVTDPSGTVRTFSPIILCVDQAPLRRLDPGQRVSDSLTLLRGGQGALFPLAGVYEIAVDVQWSIGGVECRATGTTKLMVTPAADHAHAVAALKVLSTPDALLVLALGGDHLVDGLAAVHAALDNAVLRPHFAFVEAKRVGERFNNRRPDLKRAAELIDEAAVMSGAEIKKAAKLVKAAGADASLHMGIARTLKKKATASHVSRDVQEAVDAI